MKNKKTLFTLYNYILCGKIRGYNYKDSDE